MFLSKSTWEGKRQPAAEEQLLRDISEKFDLFEFMGSDGIHPKVMKKSANVIVRRRLSSVKHHSDLGKVPDDCKKADVTPVDEKCNKQDPGNS